MMKKILGALETYQIKGYVIDNGWLYKNRELLEAWVQEDMLSNNVLPGLDMPIILSCSYEQEHELFSFTLTALGYRVENAEGFRGALIKDNIAIAADHKEVYLIEEEEI